MAARRTASRPRTFHDGGSATDAAPGPARAAAALTRASGTSGSSARRMGSILSQQCCL
jgi:hypothetical protein